MDRACAQRPAASRAEARSARSPRSSGDSCTSAARTSTARLGAPRSSSRLAFSPVREARIEEELDMVRPQSLVVRVLGEKDSESGQSFFRSAEAREKAGADDLGLASFFLGLRRWLGRRRLSGG